MPNAKRIFFAPRDSEAHKILLSEATKAGLLVPVLRELVCIVNADSDLIAFPSACQNLSEIITAIKTCWNIDPAKWELDKYHAALEWIQSSKTILCSSEKIGEKYDPKNLTGNAMFGNGIDRHPLYSLLLSSHANTDTADYSRYRLIQAHILVGVIGELKVKYSSQSEWQSLMNEYATYDAPQEWKPLLNSIRDVCLAVRKLHLSEMPYYPYFQRLPVELPPLQFAQEFLNNTDISSMAAGNKWLGMRHYHLRIFMRKVIGSLHFEARPEFEVGFRLVGNILREPSEIGVGLARRLLTLGDPDDPFIGGSDPTVLTRCKRKNPDEIRRALNADDDPFTDDGSEVETYDTSKSPRSERGGQISGWYQLQPIIMHNQLLPLSYSYLAPEEVQNFVTNAETWLSNHSSGRLKGGQVGELKLKIMQLTMLSTGCSSERVQRLVIFPHTAHEKSVDLSLRLVNDSLKTAVWRIAVINLPYMHHPEVESATQRRQSDFVLLPDILGVSRFVELLLKQSSIPATPSTSLRSIFGKNVRKLTQFAQKTLREEDAEGRLTVSKLSSFLFSQMMQETEGDVTAAAITSGQTVTLARTRLYYACVRLLRIQKAYANIFRPLVKNQEQSERSIDFADEDIWVSTRPCPTRQAVGDSVDNLIKDLVKIDPYLSIENYARYHQLYTLYTFLFQAYCIGTRAISSPILSPGQIDDDGFVWTDDKDTGSHYNAHLALCTKHLIAQLGYYAEHLNEVRQQIAWRIDSQVRYQTILNQTCFFLRVSNGRLIPEEVRRGTIEAVLFDYLSFPVNVHRRFVSGELLDSGVPPEIIDWWASHWNAGEEPWNNASTLSPEAYRSGLEQPITNLLRDLGFKPKKSALYISEVNQQ